MIRHDMKPDIPIEVRIKSKSLQSPLSPNDDEFNVQNNKTKITTDSKYFINPTFLDSLPPISRVREWKVSSVIPVTANFKLGGAKSKTRTTRVNLELRRFDNSNGGLDYLYNNINNNKCYVEKAPNNHTTIEEHMITHDDWTEIIQDDDVVILKLSYKKSKRRIKWIKHREDSRHHESDHKSSSSVSTLGLGTFSNEKRDDEDDDDSIWVTWYFSPVTKCILTKTVHNTCHLSLQYSKSAVDHVTLQFIDVKEAQSFERMLITTQQVFKSRAMIELMKFNHLRFSSPRHSQSIIHNNISSFSPSSSALVIMVEIVSALNLRTRRDNSLPNPYVVVLAGGEEVHRTSIIPSSSDPIFTVLTKSFFILSTSTEEFFSTNLIFEVHDEFDIISNAGSSYLGVAVIPNKQILLHLGERMILELKSFASLSFPVSAFYQSINETEQYFNHGSLVIKCKIANEQDIDFVQTCETKLNSCQSYPTDKKHSSSATPKKSSYLKKAKNIVTNKAQHLGKPLHPTLGEVWMTSEAIDKLTKEESRSWIELGCGDLGAVYVEVLRCDNFHPIKDDENLATDLTHAKTDSFVTLILEESVATTDVVPDCSNPRFLPWSQRAFKFNFQETSSPLLIGVFDYEGGIMNEHVLIGRVTIPLEILLPDSMYNLTYDIFDSTQIRNPKVTGQIQLRIRVELFDRRKAFWRSLNSPSSYVVNVDDKANFHHVQQTIRGRVDMDEYRLETIYSYLLELKQYTAVFFRIRDAFKSTILWRGHYEINVFRTIQLMLPIHSIVLFTGAVLITEHPEYILSFLFALFTWIMLALLELRRNEAFLLDSPPSYLGAIFAFVTGRDLFRFSHKRNHDILTAKAQNIMTRREQEEATRKEEVDNFWSSFERKEPILDIPSQGQKELFTNGLTKSSPSSSSSSKYSLLPFQVVLGRCCQHLRCLSRFFNWDYFYLSFWVTTFSFLLSLSFFIFVPTRSIVRIFVWTFFGPWMKLLDIFYFSKIESTIQGKQLLRRLGKRRKYDDQSQIKREEIEKCLAMKKFMFGNYSIKVPSLFQPDRFKCHPKAESFVVPYCAKRNSISILNKRFKAIDRNSGSIDTIPDNFSEYMSIAGDSTATPKRKNVSNSGVTEVSPLLE